MRKLSAAARSRAQAEAGENKPGLLVVRRLLAPGHTAFRAGQRERTRAAFIRSSHSRICSRFLRSRVAVNISRWLGGE